MIQINQEYVGMFELQSLTKITYIVHMHIKEGFQAKGYGLKSFKKLTEFLKETTRIKKLIGTIPAENTRIMSIVNKTKAKSCGLIKDGIIFNGLYQDLLLFELDI